MTRESRLIAKAEVVKEYIDAYNRKEYLTLGYLSKKYHMKRDTISKYIKEAGGVVINKTNWVAFDENVFDVIDTEEKAYWLGFLYADGHVGYKHNNIELGIDKRDYDHLVKFRYFLKLKSDKSITFSENICRVRVSSPNMHQKLIEKGCTPRKTLTLKFPTIDIVPDRLIRHFLRGYVDGDGSLGLYHSKKGTDDSCLHICGTPEFLTSAMLKIGVFKGCNLYDVKNTPIFNLTYKCLAARKVARLLYENSNIYLERKYNIYQKFCRYEQECSNAKSSKIGEGWNVNPEVIADIAQGSATP